MSPSEGFSFSDELLHGLLFLHFLPCLLVYIDQDEGADDEPTVPPELQQNEEFISRLAKLAGNAILRTTGLAHNFEALFGMTSGGVPRQVLRIGKSLYSHPDRSYVLVSRCTHTQTGLTYW